jgi:hypothetical protein
VKKIGRQIVGLLEAKRKTLLKDLDWTNMNQARYMYWMHVLR